MGKHLHSYSLLEVLFCGSSKEELGALQSRVEAKYRILISHRHDHRESKKKAASTVKNKPFLVVMFSTHFMTLISCTQ